MSAPISAVESMNFGLPFWLPPFGRGNGLQALYWACLAELPEHLVSPALAALGLKTSHDGPHLSIQGPTIRCPAAGPHPIATGQRPAKGPSVYGWRR